MTKPVTGQCKCTALQFTSDKPPVMQLVCHCQDCRDATSNDDCATAFFATDTCQISGDITAKAFTTWQGITTTREACRECGTFLFDKLERFAQLIGVFTDWLAPPFEAKPECHMWTNSKRAHVAIYPELKKFPKGITQPANPKTFHAEQG